ncbi:nickel/cobalt transporter [Blastochloris sulfoviridis]|uniref:Nickel/cobalt efflux system n=1 Tax=Blastochloris sulfoviridis TaxID=50712 RepID=A0A5M6I260_9HYPH|nr:nickel transporter [Blastochloris sulfoviridis]KAA5602284.1 nickel transporter [Blastochloris sulfoviridis]
MPVSRCAVRAGLVLAAVALVSLPALAQSGPFGVGPKPPPPLPDGILGWILSVQAEFYRGLTQALRAARTDPTAAGGLVALSLAYGVFHAAGPGHGKAVISAYLLANEATWRRGAALAFAAAMVQALVAVALVGIAATMVRMTALEMGATVQVIETTAYAGVLGLGLWLAWTKGRALWTAWRGGAVAGCGPGCDHTAHLDPADLAAPGGLARAAAAVLSVGLRPCSGALVVLVFALANGVLWLGVAATFAMALGTATTVAAIAALAVFAKRAALKVAVASSGRGELALRGMEFLAALAVAAFGAALLAGYMVAERVMPF